MRTPSVACLIAVLAVVVATLATGAGAAPTPITACTVLGSAGSYRLENNIDGDATGNCLTVNASHVTIDLNGFVISGPRAGARGSGAGVSITEPIRGVAVFNGTIARFAKGVSADADGVLIERIRAIDNDTGIEARSAIIKDCITVDNGTGISILTASTVHASLLTGNLVIGPAGNGLSVVPTNSLGVSVVTGNAISSEPSHPSRRAARIGPHVVYATNATSGNVEVACPSVYTDVFINNAEITLTSGVPSLPTCAIGLTGLDSVLFIP
jgi:hypothetical protein